MKGEQKNKAIFLPAELYSRIVEKVKVTEFGSVEEYVTFVLEEVLKEDESGTAFTKAEEEEVKKRLKALGYLD